MDQGQNSSELLQKKIEDITHKNKLLAEENDLLRYYVKKESGITLPQSIEELRTYLKNVKSRDENSIYKTNKVLRIPNVEDNQITEYECGKVMIRSGQGTIYKAKKRGEAEEKYAIKVSHKHQDQETREAKSIQYEVEILKDLRQHPNHKFDKDHHETYQAYPLMPTDLKNFIIQCKAHKPKNKKGFYKKVKTKRQVFKENQWMYVLWIQIVIQIASAIEYAHEGWKYVHRDLKPGNILLNQSFQEILISKGKDLIAFVCDFGCAKFKLENETLTTVTGTVFYMPPENLLFETHGSPIRNIRRGDVWAVVCILFELLIGKQAYTSKQQIIAMAANWKDIGFSTDFGNYFYFVRKIFFYVFKEESKRLNISQVLRLLKTQLKMWEKLEKGWEYDEQELVKLFDEIKDNPNKVCFTENHQDLPVSMIKVEEKEMTEDPQYVISTLDKMTEEDIKYDLEKLDKLEVDEKGEMDIKLYFLQKKQIEDQELEIGEKKTININPGAIKIFKALYEKVSKGIQNSDQELKGVSLQVSALKTTLTTQSAKQLIESMKAIKDITKIYLYFGQSSVGLDFWIDFLRFLSNPNNCPGLRVMYLNYNNTDPINLGEHIKKYLIECRGWKQDEFEMKCYNTYFEIISKDQ